MTNLFEDLKTLQLENELTANDSPAYEAIEKSDEETRVTSSAVVSVDESQAVMMEMAEVTSSSRVPANFAPPAHPGHDDDGGREAGGPPGAPGPDATLQTLANYLKTGYWSDVEGNGGRWYNIDNNGSGANNGVLYYNVNGFSSSLSTLYGNESADSNGLSAARRDVVRDVFDVYEEMLGINFVETTSTGNHVDFFFRDNAPTSGSYAASEMISGSSGAIDYTVVQLGSSSIRTVFHEIGHALGLGHQGPYNASATYADDALWENDSYQLSMMSYFSQTENTDINASSASLQTPMSVDWLALDDLYRNQDFGTNNFGLNNAFNGNTTYGFNTNITNSVSELYADLANVADARAFTIVDGSGIDTVDFSGFSDDQVINLQVASSSSTTGSISSIGGLTGNMTLAVGTVIENAIGGSGDDGLYGNGVANNLRGNSGNDTLKGFGGNDYIYGGTGADNLLGGDGNDYIYGANGVTGNGDISVNDLYGENGNDFLRGGDGNDSLYGGDDDDELRGNAGNDLIDGGDGIDEADYQYATSAVNVNLVTGTATGGDGNDTLVDIENISGSDYNDTLTGNISHNTILGWDGDDTIDGGYGLDVMDGGGGYDTMDVSWFNSSYDLNMVSGQTNFVGETAVNFESVITGNGDDDIQGNAVSNTITTNGGNDIINGGAGIDIMEGGAGHDIYYVDNANDTTVEAANEGYDRVYVDGVSTWTLASNMERLTFTDSGNHVGYGNEGSNRMEGNEGNDRFVIDGGGSDIYSGGQGTDTYDARSSDIGVRVYLNNQTLNGGAALDETFVSMEIIGGSNKPGSVASGAGDVMRAGPGRASFAGYNGDDLLIGANNHDQLNGGHGNDTLIGGSGRDTLIGGEGNDLMTGGNDLDQFRFISSNFGQDTITDFQDNLDKLRFFSAVADDFNDFTITGNGTSTVTVSLDADPTNFITVNGIGGSNLNIDAGDIWFY